MKKAIILSTITISLITAATHTIAKPRHHPMWQCKAKKASGQSYTSKRYHHKRDAERDALRYCRHKAVSPASCRIVSCYKVR